MGSFLGCLSNDTQDNTTPTKEFHLIFIVAMLMQALTPFYKGGRLGLESLGHLLKATQLNQEGLGL